MCGYESLAWIKDKHGKEYVYPVNVLKGDFSDREEPTEEERRRCMDVNLIIGTERWLRQYPSYSPVQPARGNSFYPFP